MRKKRILTAEWKLKWKIIFHAELIVDVTATMNRPFLDRSLVLSLTLFERFHSRQIGGPSCADNTPGDTTRTVDVVSYVGRQHKVTCAKANDKKDETDNNITYKKRTRSLLLRRLREKIVKRIKAKIKRLKSRRPIFAK